MAKIRMSPSFTISLFLIVISIACLYFLWGKATIDRQFRSMTLLLDIACVFIPPLSCRQYDISPWLCVWTFLIGISDFLLWLIDHNSRISEKIPRNVYFIQIVENVLILGIIIYAMTDIGEFSPIDKALFGMMGVFCGGLILYFMTRCRNMEMAQEICQTAIVDIFCILFNLKYLVIDRQYTELFIYPIILLCAIDLIKIKLLRNLH